jgi:hypothetical protein
MRFRERKEFLYDPALWRRSDTQTALTLYREHVRASAPRPYPKFFEVDRRSQIIDSLWHVPLDSRTAFSRVLEIPCINTHEKNRWRLTKTGRFAQRVDKFTIANLDLREFDYFPEGGDLVYYNGYRYMIDHVSLEPQGYWHQTNVWMGLVIECFIPPDGDARPVVNPGEAVPSEVGQPLPEA